jgi:hypothetical protein
VAINSADLAPALHGDPDTWAEQMYALGWDDGLPIVPPTPSKVEEFCRVLGFQPDRVVFRMPPSNRRATAGALAANAIMAGAKAEYFPVIVTALVATAQREFNLNALQCSTHMVAPLVIVNGPVCHELGINSGAGVFGPGPRSNATIGRAVRLAMLNIGGARPGEMDRSTLGNPAKLSYCIAENEEASPWEPFHASQGFDASSSVVTVFQAEAPHSVTNHVSSDPQEILMSIASVMATLGSNNAWLMGKMLVVVGPEHAASLGLAKWSREDVQRFLYQRARVSMDVRQFGRSKPERFHNRHWPAWFDRQSSDETWPMVTNPQDILVVVAGGLEGRFSAVVPSWGLPQPVSRKVVVDCDDACQIQGV